MGLHLCAGKYSSFSDNPIQCQRTGFFSINSENILVEIFGLGYNTGARASLFPDPALSLTLFGHNINNNTPWCWARFVAHLIIAGPC